MTRWARLLVSSWAIVVLAACGGSPAPFTPAQQAVVAPSWMAPEAKGQSLLYVSDQGDNLIAVYTYPFGKRVGTLTGFRQPAGVCADSAGDVWVVNSAALRLVEYAHGGKTPLRTLADDSASNLLGCAVDPATGDLAVTDSGGPSVAGDVTVYNDAKGRPKKHHDADLEVVYFCSYDNAGNLFVDGFDRDGVFHLVELPAGSGTMKTIKLDASIKFPGGIQWDGKYLAVGDREYKGNHQSAILRFTVSGASGHGNGVTVLDDSCDVLQFAIPKLGTGHGNPQGSRVVAPDVCRNTTAIYNYPDEGAPAKTLGGFQNPIAAAVSK